MKKLVLLVSLSVLPIVTFAQDEETEAPKDGWTKAGNMAFLLSQAAFNAEWTGGGTSNYAINGNLSYDINYRKGKITWDNKFLADYGITKIADQDFTRKTNDRLEINSIVGRQIKESNWSYSAFANFRTQFAKGYNFGKDVNGNETRTEITNFMSPGYLSFGPGMQWKKGENLRVNIAPASPRFIFVSSKFTNVGNDQALIDAFNMAGGYFGVEANETSRFEFGAAVNALAQFKLMENISMENILNLYSNYLEDPQNVDIDYTMNLVMAVNEWITANFVFQAIYDDNAVKGFQIRQGLGVGLTFGL